MKTSVVLFLTICLLLFSTWVFSTEYSELKAFPAAANGMERLVIELPVKEREEEARFQVELIPGKTMWTDGLNLIKLGCTISSQPLKGWGYTYYEVVGSDVAMSTMMAAPGGGQKVEEFVSCTSLFVRYNSRLPIVVYIPKGYEVRYRVWNAGATDKAIKR